MNFIAAKAIHWGEGGIVPDVFSYWVAHGTHYWVDDIDGEQGFEFSYAIDCSF